MCHCFNFTNVKSKSKIFCICLRIDRDIDFGEKKPSNNFFNYITKYFYSLFRISRLSKMNKLDLQSVPKYTKIIERWKDREQFLFKQLSIT